MRAVRMLLEWVIPWLGLCLALSAAEDGTSQLKLARAPKITEVASTRLDQFCSTWGNFHFSNFDGDSFQLPFKCQYVLASDCKNEYESFSIELKRQKKQGVVSIKKILMKLDGITVKVDQDVVQVLDQVVKQSYSKHGVAVTKTPSYVKVEARLGVSVMMFKDNALWIELHPKFKNQTCGLCGDFNGIPNDEFTISEFKWILPTDPQKDMCEKLLLGPAFTSCQDLVDTDSFIEACGKDLCDCSDKTTCMCSTVTEFSRQCAHLGGTPQKWKTEQLCAETCPFNMEYQECGIPCSDTCTNRERSQLCEDHCVDGCFCPKGTVFDDITQTGCVPVTQCPCLHEGKSYHEGEGFSRTCENCKCVKGSWSCERVDCPGICSILGGSHVTTFDDKRYTFHGDCAYVLSKATSGSFSVLGELSKCIKSTRSTCLTAVTLLLSNQMLLEVNVHGKVSFNKFNTQLPFITDDFIVFKPSMSYIIISTRYDLNIEIQIEPIMQVHIISGVSNKGNLKGLCGNFNDMEADDFKATNGMIEGTAALYADSWRSKPNCPAAICRLESPCSSSVDKEEYGEHWCTKLTDPKGFFAKCHSVVDPADFEEDCMYDTCVCGNSEKCMCGAFSAYVHACEAEGVSMSKWRDTACEITQCPSNLVFDYKMESCGRTCRSLSQSDLTCGVEHTPVDGCGCAEGTYFYEGSCKIASKCPCFVEDIEVSPGQLIKIQGQTCKSSTKRTGVICNTFLLSTACKSPMVFFNCSSAKPGEKGSECQKSCQTAEAECVSKQCMSGCVCPDGLLSDDKGGCVAEENCPCTYNGETYQSGESVSVDCNTCTCKGRTWNCTTKHCGGMCTLHGQGRYITFDEKKFSFTGGCSYILAQDHCGDNVEGSFRVVVENVPCGTTESTCSLMIKLYLGNKEIILSEEGVKVVKQSKGKEIPYKFLPVGLYLAVEAKNGLVLTWNKKTTVMLKVSAAYKRKVCGLCGDFDGNSKNDFITRGKEAVVEAFRFGNSWRVDPTCPDSEPQDNLCTLYSHKQAWAFKHCSIINSQVFAPCHSKVDPHYFFATCLRDTCSCSAGGDCDCFCSAVADYAAACNKVGACVKWRTPTICPMFCDFYNPDDECEWHYEPCGKSCMKTCRNPSGKCFNHIQPLEGCYPSCPPDRSYLEEVSMRCVSKEECGCYDDDGNHYNEGDPIPSTENCQICNCQSTEKRCNYDVKVYDTHDGDGACITATCGENGNITIAFEKCPSTTSPPSSTTFSFSTTDCYRCEWTEWINSNYPDENSDGDSELIENMRKTTLSSCSEIQDIHCRAVQHKDTPLSNLGQKVVCNKSLGLLCKKNEQVPVPVCEDFEIQVKCCRNTSATTICSCKFEGKIFSPGTYMYNVTDGQGSCFTSYCNLSCIAVKHVVPCHSTTPSPTNTTESPRTTTQTTSTSAVPCVPKHVCVFSNTEYKPGTTFSKGPCETCICTNREDPNTKLNEFECATMSCLSKCPEGYEFETIPGQCCQLCKKTKCVLKIPGLPSPKYLEPSESWSPENDKCTKYECKKEKDEFVHTVTQISCPPFDPDNCVPGSEQTDSNGCCRTCTPRAGCLKQTNSTYLQIDGCTTVDPVELTFCSGSCGPSSSIYSAETNSIMHTCSCCHELSTSQKEVDVTCPGGDTKKATYISVDECGCKADKC
ncbi:mucin-2-like [Halichoeres trimaculatus]|uniref:mucin-2-like n=1 Tax=Halichoeres trimaculatus TaxID=147232 RepID=UPI003D9E2C16